MATPKVARVCIQGPQGPSSIPSLRDFAANTGQDFKSTFAAAMTALGALGGGTLIVPPGTWKFTTNNIIPANVHLWFHGDAVIEPLDTAAHLFRPAGGNLIRGLKVAGLGEGEVAGSGFAAVAIQGASDVVLQGLEVENAHCDVVYLRNCSDVLLDGVKGTAAGRNLVSMNDTASGSKRVTIRRLVGSSFLHGFDAESDSAYLVEGIDIDDVDWTYIGVGDFQTAAVAFTRSASPATSIIKYQNLSIRNVRSHGGYYGMVLRAAKDIEIEGLAIRQPLASGNDQLDAARRVRKGISAGAGNHVEDLRVLSGNIEAALTGIEVLSPSGQTRSRGFSTGQVRLHGFSDSGAMGIYSEADEVEIGAGTTIDMKGAANSRGQRLAGNLVRTRAKVKDARSAYVQLDGSTDRRMAAKGGMFEATTGAAADDVLITGTSPNIVVEDNIGP